MIWCIIFYFSVTGARWLKACFTKNVLIHGIAIQGGGAFSHIYAEKYTLQYDYQSNKDIPYKENGVIKVCNLYNHFTYK